MDIGGKHVDVLTRLLGATELRAKVISTNIANENTPGYTRQVVRFEEQLREVVRKGGRVSQLSPEIVADTEGEARPDGNNVALEVELNAMRENRILYETYAAMLKSHFDLIEASISESR